ncbi:flagellar biosynthesis regulator FlhF [Treponema sp. R8-4-B8]
METLIEQGETLMECKQKISEKYKQPFHIQSRKDIRLGGFLGLFTKSGVQVEFYLTPQRQNTQIFDYNPRLPFSQQSGMQYAAGVDPFSDKNLEEAKKKVIETARKNIGEISANGRETSQQILDLLKEGIKEIKEKVESSGKKEEHPSFVRITEMLKTNDFSEKYINGMLERLRKELSLEQLDNFKIVQDRILEWIGESISIYKEEAVTRKPRIMVLIGPTGSGKTTTISKLAAIYGIGTDEIPAIDVRLITIDTFRICAKEQLEQIGVIMRIPVSCALNKQDIRKEIALCGEDIDLILIDTFGNSPKDSIMIGEMKEILDGCPKSAEYHLVISAATKTSDIEVIMRQFEPFNYKSIILTKMDETSSFGNIISALSEKKKSISFITNGQGVPEDIRRASVVRFLIELDGFKIDRDKIEKRFPSGGADQFKWR